MKTPATHEFLNQWADQVALALHTPLWLETIGNYKCTPVPRSRWRRVYDWVHVRTVCRFRMWLNRDCGSDW